MGLQEAKESIITYFKGVKSEWGKITWPTKEQVRNETIAVILIVFAFTIFILDKLCCLFEFRLFGAKLNSLH